MKLNTLFNLSKLPDAMRNEDTILYLLEHADKNSFSDADLDAIDPMTPALMRRIVARNPNFFSEEWRHETLNGYTFDIKLAAVKAHPTLIRYLEAPCEALQLEAVKRDGHVVRFYSAPISTEVQLMAVASAPDALQYFTTPSDALTLEALRRDPELICTLEPLSREVILKAIETNPMTVVILQDKIGQEISGDTIDLYERALPKDSFAQILYGDDIWARMRADLCVNELMRPETRQLEVLARVLRVLTRSNCLMDVSLTRKFILPNLAMVPLGKKCQTEWLQKDGEGRVMLEWLDQMRDAVHVIRNSVALPVTHDTKLARFVERAGRQLEWGLSARQSVPEVARTDSGRSRERDVL